MRRIFLTFYPYALEIVIKSKENQLCALTAVIAMRRVTNAFLSADGCEKTSLE